MDTAFDSALFLQLLAGICLAAAAGLRAFVPPLVIGALARFDIIPLRESMEWLESAPALVVFGTAVLVEVLADKIPWLDHALDVVGMGIKPAAGALVLATVVTDLSPLATAVLALVLGGSVAGTVHLSRAGLRVASTGATGGLANPILSAAEDGASLGGTLVAIFAPLLVLAAGVVSMVGLRIFARRRRTRLSSI